MKLSLTQTLIDSQETRKQIIGSYTKIKQKGEYVTEITGYCAMGALFCEAGEVNSSGHVQLTTFDLFKLKYGLKAKQIKETFTCPYCKIDRSWLGSYIVHLNDTHEKTFKQIGKHLRKLGF